MKTTKVFIALFSVLAVANLFLSEWLIFGYVVLCLIFNGLLLHEEKKNAQLTSKLTDAEEKFSELEDELNHSIRTVKLQFQESNDLNLKIISLKSEIEAKKAFEESQRVKHFELLVEISDLKTQLETAKANSYTEVERKRGREKYARLYKGKKKSEVATEQKRKPNKIEPFRMVVNPKQSAIVQQILFDNGYAWASENKEILYTYAKNLFLEESITFEDNEEKLKFDERMMLPKLSFRKFMSMYGKKQEPYTIEGKTIKQLVEENLGIEIDLESYGLFYLCGYDKEFENCEITANWSPFLIGNDKIANSSYHKDKIILKNYSNVEWCNSELVISAIKKHRNIQ